PVHYGTMPLGSNLIVEPDEYEHAASDPIATKYLRRFLGARELINGTDRWCLWMGDTDFSPGDVSASPFLKQRVEASRAWRGSQTETGDAYKHRDIPHLFRPNKNRPTEPYVCIPIHVTET